MSTITWELAAKIEAEFTAARSFGSSSQTNRGVNMYGTHATDVVGYGHDGDLSCPSCHGPETENCEGVCGPVFGNAECGPLGDTCCQPVQRTPNGKWEQCGEVILPAWEGTESDHLNWYGDTRYMQPPEDDESGEESDDDIPHTDYPHPLGQSDSCVACAQKCFCTPGFPGDGTTECVYCAELTESTRDDRPHLP